MSVRGSLRGLFKRIPSNAVNYDESASENGETSTITNSTPTTGDENATTIINPISNPTLNSNVNIDTDVHTSTAYNTETETESIVTPTIKARSGTRKASGTRRLAGTKRTTRDFSAGDRSGKRNSGVGGKQSQITGFAVSSKPLDATGSGSQSTTNETTEHPPTTPTGRDRLPRSLEDAYSSLKKHNIAHKSNISNARDLAALFTIITQCCIEAKSERLAIVAEVVEALSIITMTLLEKKREDKLVASLREATKEILTSSKERLEKTAEEVVGNARKAMGRMEKAIDTCTDTLKVAANDTAAAAETTRSYAKVAAAGSPNVVSAQGSKAQAGPIRFWERDSKRLIIDPRQGASLLNEGENTSGLLKRMTEAWRKAGGKEQWEFVAGGRLEKGGYIRKTSFLPGADGS
ncbi:hypothetical protein ONZ45_g14804 [Pleurotus djamor]|nr:hypothetical protein ONZ45_g14804 [Pleurotus djamor]